MRQQAFRLSIATAAMFPILEAALLAPGVKRFTVEAPRVARHQRPGQFVIVRLHEHGERIPLTIAAADAERGSIDLVVQAVGRTTHVLHTLGRGDQVLDVAGPLGRPSELARFGTVAAVAGGVGAAVILPIAAVLRDAGNRVVAIVGARTREQVILERELGAASHDLIVTTDDGSYGRAGFVTERLAEVLAREPIDRVLAAGPIAMMRAVAELTRSTGVVTVVSLNPIMVDGTGMCGGCRVLVDGQSRFACVDGPAFDAHRVDFEVLARRNTMYRPQERASLERLLTEQRVGACV